MKCSNCGNEISYDSGFCPFCGTKVVSASDYSNVNWNQTADFGDIISRVLFSLLYLILFISSFFTWFTCSDRYFSYPLNPFYENIVTDQMSKTARGFAVICLIILLLVMMLAIIFAALGKKNDRKVCGALGFIFAIIILLICWIDLKKGFPGVAFWIHLVLGIVGLTQAIDNIGTGNTQNSDTMSVPKMQSPVLPPAPEKSETVLLQHMTYSGAPFECVYSKMVTDSNDRRYIENLFRNLSKQNIIAIQVDIVGMDIFGTATETVSKYPYQNFVIANGQKYGKDIHIPVNNPNTVKYSLTVNIVMFEDGSVWKREEERWKALEIDYPKDFIFEDHIPALKQMNNSSFKILEYMKTIPSQDPRYLAVMKELEGMVMYEKYYGKPGESIILILQKVYNNYSVGETEM